jgi:hypothetical protein
MLSLSFSRGKVEEIGIQVHQSDQVELDRSPLMRDPLNSICQRASSVEQQQIHPSVGLTGGKFRHRRRVAS